MAEYINKNAAYDYATLDSWYIASVTNGTPVWTEEHLEELLKDFYVIPKDTPVVDVEPVKHGTWEYMGLCLKCSECGLSIHIGSYNERTLKHQANVRHYCERCGAKMEVSKNG